MTPFEFDPPPHRMSEVAEGDVLAAIGRLSFRFARTMPQWPHEYTVRNRSDPDQHKAYMALYDAIKEHGVVERFTGTGKPSFKRYLYAGDGYRYWFENQDRNMSRIINRNLVEDAEKLRARGLIS
jgi:hypothetical protein